MISRPGVSPVCHFGRCCKGFLFDKQDYTYLDMEAFDLQALSGG